MVDNSHKFALQEKAWIDAIIKQIAASFMAYNVPPHIACASLMLMASDAAAQSDENDEYIIDQFKHCLAQSRKIIKSRGH